jgi:hypothetical protein
MSISVALVSTHDGAVETVVLANFDLIDKLGVVVLLFASRSGTYCPLSWLLYSLPSAAVRRFSSRSSFSAINSAFCSAPSSAPE